MQENSKIDFKIGDLVTIKSEPEYWSSLCCTMSPISCSSNIEYPYTARITDIKPSVGHLSAKIGDYGWQLSYLIEKDLITNVNPPENEIVLIPEKLMTVWQRGGTFKHERLVFARIGNKFLAWADIMRNFAITWDFAEEIQ